MSLQVQSNKRLQHLLHQLSLTTTTENKTNTNTHLPSILNIHKTSNNTNNSNNTREVTKVTDISAIYDSSSLSFQQERFSSLISLFSQTYNGDKPDFIVRSPGRVNIIGEHIDYCGYDVLPMAVEPDILFLCKILPLNDNSNNNIIHLSNTNGKFKPKTINLNNINEATIDLASQHRDWTDYFKAGLSGVLKEYYNGVKPPQTTLRGLEILVDGNLPQGSGLSSSSAFVCATVVSLLHSNDGVKRYPRGLNCTKIAMTSIECEKEVGVDSGGMDQTICMMANKGYAKYIEFIPKLNATSVKLPDSNQFCFIIANCLKSHQLMDNLGTKNYNTRVVECRLATLIVAKKLKIKNWQKVATMRELQDACGASLDEMINITLKHLNSDPYCLGTIEKELGIDFYNRNVALEDFMFGLKTGKTVIKNLRKMDYKLPLQSRMLHVYSEAMRVIKFVNICNDNNNNNRNNGSSSASVAKRLGELMVDSHMSCDQQYDCSCDELNTLQTVCMEGGSLGSRLTGAGWGGCVVSLINKSNVNYFINYVKQHYYRNIQNVPSNAIFETTPSAALTIVNL